MKESAVEVVYRESCDEFRVVVCGGRKYSNQVFLNHTLDTVHASRKITLIIEGGADGADALARTWAIMRGIQYKTFKANWDNLKNAAGGIRNQQMIDEGKPDYGVAFKGFIGTPDMVAKLKKAGIPLLDLQNAQ